MSEETGKLVVRFDGDPRRWDVFKARFLALAAKKGYGGILDGTVVPPVTMYVGGKPNAHTDADAIKLLDLLKAAYADLVIAINTESDAGMAAFNIVQSHKREGSDYLDGNVREAWLALDTAYSRKGASRTAGYTADWESFRVRSGEAPQLSLPD